MASDSLGIGLFSNTKEGEIKMQAIRDNALSFNIITRRGYQKIQDEKFAITWDNIQSREVNGSGQKVYRVQNSAQLKAFDQESGPTAIETFYLADSDSTTGADVILGKNCKIRKGTQGDGVGVLTLIDKTSRDSNGILQQKLNRELEKKKEEERLLEAERKKREKDAAKKKTDKGRVPGK